MFGLRRPKHPVLGSDVAGRVEAIGKGAKQFQPGDEVFGDVSVCGFGAFAEYVCAKETAVLRKPAGTPFEEAAAVPVAAVTALQGLRDGGKVQPGQRVLVNGASGGVGTFAVQIAKSFGAEVTGVCSTRNVDMVRSLGADEVIDYTQNDFTRNGERFDLILDVAAYRSLNDHKRALRPHGTYVLIGGGMARFSQAILLGPWMSMTGSRKVRTLMAKPNRKDLTALADLLETGKIKPVIDRRYTLPEVPEAIRYLEDEHGRGKIVITV